MTFKYKRVTVRPNTNTEFWKFSEEDLNYIKENFVDTGKRLSFIETYSDDLLTQTWEFEWVDRAAFFDYGLALSEAWEMRNEHNNINNIFTEVIPDSEHNHQ
jgi:hypothetical protein